MDGKELSLSLLFCIFSIVNCCIENTFNNTAVTLVGAKDIRTITGCFEPTEDLVKVSYIQIVNESVPILRRGAINGLPNLVDVVLERNSMQDIDPDSFYNLPKLYLIKIKQNNIRVLREGVFNGLNLTELCLTDNNIEIIYPNAFDDMPKLSILFLNENKITRWRSDWFKRSPQVSVLNFEYNLITTVPYRCLQNVKSSHLIGNVRVDTNVQLNNNRIKKIEDGAFEGLEMLGWLFLHKTK
ncbi:hypothetical protein NQ317_012532 [Molorchus minor]|uniref:Uncharacterized protein n=1 Tax=Molorchus minor TaxID=1323400 RepID=A0ABQ9K1G6_9CUCU|nr:hypothetical protein NQ317_012532 [Molorchus minor]